MNCDATVAASARFCAGCGQRTDTARLRFGDIARDLMQRFVDIERGPLAFSRALLTGPGRVARDYVDGRRRRHYGPFATLVVLVGLTALAVNFSGYQVLAHDGLSAGPTALLQRHFNLLLLVQLPILGAACALLFRGAALTLPEHMVLVAYTLGMRAVFLMLLNPVRQRLQALLFGDRRPCAALRTERRKDVLQRIHRLRLVDLRPQDVRHQLAFFE